MAFLFKYPENYITQERVRDASTPTDVVYAVSDNDYNTHTDLTSLNIFTDADADGTGTAQEFTHIFIKGKNITGLAFTFTGGNLADVAAHTISNTLSNGVSIVDAYKFQNILYKFVHTATPMAQAINLTVMGTATEIAEIMILNELYEFDMDFSTDGDKTNAGLSHAVVLGHRIRPTAGGTSGIVPALNGVRNKNRVNYTMRFAEDESLDAFLMIMETELELVIAPDPELYPRLIYPASVVAQEITIDYEENTKIGSRTLPVTFQEL